MPIRTLIVDDEPLAREKLRGLLGAETDLEVVGEAGDGVAAVQAILKLKPELVLLDVQMPELDGFGVLQSLQGRHHVPAVVFITAHDQFALRAFEVHAVDYLLKPFDRERLVQALDRARETLRHRRTGDADRHLSALLQEMARTRQSSVRIAVKAEGRILLVRTEEIDWIEAADNYACLHVGRSRYLLRETLTALEKRLPAEVFVRISRSAIVNLDRVRELQPMFHGDYVIVLQDGATLNLSRTHRSKLAQFLEKSG